MPVPTRMRHRFRAAARITLKRSASWRDDTPSVAAIHYYTIFAKSVDVKRFHLQPDKRANAIIRSSYLKDHAISLRIR